MNIAEEKEASRLRVENKRAEECAGRLLKTLPGGSTLQEYMVAGLERWPGMTTDQHAAISKEIRNHLEGETDVARSQIVELKIWLRTYIKKELEADPTLNLKAPATWTLAQDAGMARVSYETFRTQYFYPIRDEVLDELGIAKPAPKKGQKGFKTTARQKSDAKKAKERKEKAEKAAEDLEEAGKALVADLNKRAVEKAAEEGDLLDAFEKKKNGKPGSSDPPTYPEVNPPDRQVTATRPPSDPQVSVEERPPEIPFCEDAGPSPSNRGIAANGNWSCLICGAKGPPEKGQGAHLRGVNLHPEPSPGSEGDPQQAAEDVAPGSSPFPFQHSTEVHEKAHRELREEYVRNRLAFDRDDAGDTIEEPSLVDIEGEGEAAFPVDDESLRALEKEYSLGKLVEGRVRAKIAAMLKNQRASLSVSNEDGWMEMHRPESGGVLLEIRANDLEGFDRFMELLSVVLKPLLKV